MKLPISNDEWMRIRRLVPSSLARDLIMNQAKACLADVPADAAISTKELTELMFPLITTQGDGIEVHRWLMNMLVRLSAEDPMKNCYFLGEPKERYGRLCYPRMWHAEREPEPADHAKRISSVVASECAALGRETALALYRAACDALETEDVQF